MDKESLEQHKKHMKSHIELFVFYNETLGDKLHWTTGDQAVELFNGYIHSHALVQSSAIQHQIVLKDPV